MGSILRWEEGGDVGSILRWDLGLRRRNSNNCPPRQMLLRVGLEEEEEREEEQEEEARTVCLGLATGADIRPEADGLVCHVCHV